MVGWRLDKGEAQVEAQENGTDELDAKDRHPCQEGISQEPWAPTTNDFWPVAR